MYTGVMYTLSLFLVLVSCTPAPAKVAYTDSPASPVTNADGDVDDEDRPSPSEPGADESLDPDADPGPEDEGGDPTEPVAYSSSGGGGGGAVTGRVNGDASRRSSI